MATVTQKCHCGTLFLAREADVKRGWAKSCSKSCAAVARERKLDRNGYRSHAKRQSRGTDMLVMLQHKEQLSYINMEDDYDDDPSWDAHKSY